INSRLTEHLHRCSGNAVVVFDEVQKVIPHTLDVLLEMMSARAQLVYSKGGITRTLDTSNVIFVFVSDIGVAEMRDALIKYKSRESIPRIKLENSIKNALDAQWERLQFGKVIDKAIPFLPFEPKHIEEIIAFKLSQLDENYRGKYWHRLWIDPGIPYFMSRLDSMLYEKLHIKIDGEARQPKLFAKYGARNVETGPIQFLKSKLLRSIRPFNPDAEVRIDFVENSKRVSITLCAAEVLKRKSSVPIAETDEFTPVSCVVKWEGALE
uniref:ATPase AAA-type core domain-containing protein n=1 Tax=Globisporangium ultimum (strain ATCC 200006 / CBS 805.95 / DAOM BR144) TaxID=431595 RepID=K3WL50_GLOUD